MNARGKKVDKTFLSVDNAEARGFIHRDYIAHCFRWTHAAKAIQSRWRDAIILDVGCGKEMPLPKLIYSSKMRPLDYCGIDVGDWPIPDMLKTATFPVRRCVGDIAEVKDLKQLFLKKTPPNFVTCFEVLEHVEWDHAKQALEVIRKLISPSGLFMVSTPCWNFKDCADNHVNEMTYEAFGALLEATGWTIRAHYGTFASQADLKKLWLDTPDLAQLEVKQTFERLQPYYDSNVLSTIFAPLYPQISRNVIWDCVPRFTDKTRMFRKLNNIPHPWGSAERKDCLKVHSTGRSKV